VNHSFLSYIKYFFNAKSKYGIHSPFVFDFVTKGLDHKVSTSSLNSLAQYRKRLSRDTRIIDVTDFGAGSKVFKSNQRKVSKIAYYAGISKKKGIVLQKIVHYFKPTKVLEVGTSLGIGTAAMTSVGENLQIVSLEGCPKTANVAKEYFEKNFPDANINVEVGEFSHTLPEVLKDSIYDLIYFDGNHRKQPTIAYFELALESIDNDSLFIFDDIHWSKEMEEAWTYIKAHKKVSVTIDLFHLGLVFFRKEQAKQDFVIKT